jgi:membrane-associated phospholipid phosphatase
MLVVGLFFTVAPIARPAANDVRGPAKPATSSGLVVQEWNLIAANATLTASPALAPVAQVRAMAIVQAAVHDAVNAITGEFDTYGDAESAPAGASPEAAAIAAAYHAIRGLFGGSGALDTAYTDSLIDHGVDTGDPGLAFGEAVGIAAVASRANDGASSAQFAYTAPGAGQPGVWAHVTSAPALLAGWGDVTPFVLRSADQFLPEPPPALDSERYARDYNEVRVLGRSNSAVRTQTQTDIALFWRGSPTAIWNPLIHQALSAQPMGLSETARAFALVYLAGADAGVACWHAKYAYNFWRPQPAIVNGALDGNDDTAADGTWLPLIGTPPHPEYVSGHTSNSGAMGFVLALLFGDEPGVPLVNTLTGITREWYAFSEAVDEVIDARVYSGIHFRTADEAGARLGQQVGRFVFTHALTATRGQH